MVQAGRAQEEAISYTGTQKRSPLTHVSKGEQASAGGGEGNSDRGITSEGNEPPVWGTAGKLSCGQRRGNMLSLFRIWCGPYVLHYSPDFFCFAQGHGTESQSQMENVLQFSAATPEMATRERFSAS